MCQFLFFYSPVIIFAFDSSFFPGLLNVVISDLDDFSRMVSGKIEMFPNDILIVKAVFMQFVIDRSGGQGISWLQLPVSYLQEL